MTLKINKTTLDNGVRIISQKMPHIRSVSVGVWVDAGARDESAKENGLSHLIEHMIFKGTQRRSACQIAKEFDAIGGYSNAFTSMENTCYHAKVMDTHLESMVDILSDIVLNSRFDQDELRRESPVILQEISMMEDNPEEYVHVISNQNYWGDNALGRSILGTRENIIGFDSQRVKTFFKHLYQPERIVISACGSLEHSQIVDLLADSFMSIPLGEPIKQRTAPHVHPTVYSRTRPIEQVHICLNLKGLSICDSQRYAASILNTILGGNMSSRLFQEIREKRGLAYSVYSYLTSYNDTGMLGVYAGAEPAKLRQVMELIMEQMDALHERPIGAAELEDAKEYTKASILLSSESADNRMVRLAQNELNFGRHIPIKTVVERIEAVTSDEIHCLAKDLFSRDRLAITVLGPIEAQEVLQIASDLS